MNKKLILLLMVSSFLLISGCGGDDKKSATGALEDFLRKPESTEKFIAVMKQEANNGKMTDPIMFVINEDVQVTTVRMQRQDPKKLENIDEFFYLASQGSWTETPVQATISGKAATAEQISAAAWDIDIVNWKAVPDIIKDVENRMKDIEGAKITSMTVSEEHIYIPIQGTRKKASYKANLDGTFKSFE